MAAENAVVGTYILQALHRAAHLVCLEIVAFVIVDCDIILVRLDKEQMFCGHHKFEGVTVVVKSQAAVAFCGSCLNLARGIQAESQFEKEIREYQRKCKITCRSDKDIQIMLFVLKPLS